GGIAAERGDVALHPFQAGDLVHEAVVAEDRAGLFCGNCRVREETESREPVVDRDEDDALLRERRSVVPGPRGGPVAQTAAVDPEHDRKPPARCIRRRPHVEKQAVLALWLVVLAMLHAVVPEL